MIILNPQWQGIGRINPVPKGADMIKALLNGISYENVPSDHRPIRLENNIYGLTPITEITRDVSKRIESRKPSKICTLGGDCSSDFAALTYLNHLYEGQMGVIWVDAHPDLNTPESSPSANFHGMTLRTLCGEGPVEMCELLKRPLIPEQLIFAAARSIDAEEARFMSTNQRHNAAVSDLNKNLPDLSLFPRFKNIYLHVDIDSLDGRLFDDCATPTIPGLTVEGLLRLIEFIQKSFNVVGTALTEYGPKTNNSGLKIIERVLFEGLKIKNF